MVDRHYSDIYDFFIGTLITSQCWRTIFPPLRGYKIAANFSVMKKTEVAMDWCKLEIEVEVFPRKAFASKPIATSVEDYLATSGLPSWCAPHLCFGATDGVYLPKLSDWAWADDWNETAYRNAVTSFPDSYVLGAAQSDQPIILLPDDSAIYTFSDAGSSLKLLNTSPYKLARTVYAFAEMVEKAVSVNSTAFTQSCVPQTLVDEFEDELFRLDPGLRRGDSIWQEWALQTCQNA